MKRSRTLYLHKETNPGKLAALEDLHVEYLRYLRACVDRMISAHRPKVSRKEILSFFPIEKALSTNLVMACQQHAVEIVSGWFSATYQRRLKRHIKDLHREGAIDEVTKIALFIIGKHGIEKPWEVVTQEHLDLYWTLLLDPDVSGRPPTISQRVGMRLSVHTSDLREVSRDLTSWWIGISCLKKGRRVQLPLKPNPFVKSPEDVTNGCLVRKDRLGRWRIEILEKKLVDEPKFDPNLPRVGVDIGLNVMAATSGGRLYGERVKPKFDRLYARVRSLRANRQRQGFKENSPRLDKLEMRLTGMVKTATGEAANRLVADHPGHVFVLEDLDLQGCRGQKRFAYRALQTSLEKKAPTLKVNAAYTSQMCPSCGYIHRGNRKGTEFQCLSCGRISHADVVGGINLLGRSEDQGVDLDDHPSVVRTLLRERFRLRRTSSLGEINALVAPNRRLTIGVRPQGQTGIASNAEGRPA